MLQNAQINKNKALNSRLSTDNNSVSLLQMARLQNNIETIFKKNKQKYKIISNYEPNFQVKLYQPKQIFNTQKGLRKQILLKQIDKLMDQESIFDKKIAHLNFLKEQQNDKAKNLIQQQINPYKILHTVWQNHKKNNSQCNNSLQRIEFLNFTIGKIKSTILVMKNQQQKQQKTQLRLQKNHYPNNQNQNFKIKEKYDKIIQQNQKLNNNISKLEQKLKQKNKQTQILNEKIYTLQKQLKVEKQNNITRKLQITQLKECLFVVQRKIDKIQKWKKNIQKLTFQNPQQKFKIYIQNNYKPQQQQPNNNKYIFKTIEQIQSFLNEKISQKKKDYNLSSKSDQQKKIEKQFSMNLLDLAENEEFNNSKKQISTDRTNCQNPYQLNKFLQSKINVRYNKMASFINDQKMKKFVRKNQISYSTYKRIATTQNQSIKINQFIPLV